MIFTIHTLIHTPDENQFDDIEKAIAFHVLCTIRTQSRTMKTHIHSDMPYTLNAFRDILIQKMRYCR